MTFEHNSQATSPHHARAFAPRSGIVARISAPVTVHSTEQVVLSWLCPANYLQDGAFIRIELAGNYTSSTPAGKPFMFARIGPTTLVGQTVAGVNAEGVDGQIANSVRLTALVSINAAGSAGYTRGIATIYLGSGDGGGVDDPDSVTSLSAFTPDGPIDFTIDNLIEVTFWTANGDPFTFWIGSIEIVSTGG